MSPDTAPDIRALLDEAPTPDHGDGFWAALHGDLATGGDGAPVRLAGAGSGRRGPGRWLLSVAAVALVAVGAAVFLTTRDDGAVPVTSDPTTTTTEATAPAGPLRVAGEPIERGAGRPVAIDPTGRFLYLTDAATEGGRGCEGADRQALWVVPVEGGERRQVIGADVLDATGRVDLRFDGAGRVAARSMCEGHGAEIIVARVAAAGTFDEASTLTVSDQDLGVEAGAVTDFAWRGSNELLATTWTTSDQEHRHLYALSVDDPGRGASDLGVDGAIRVLVADDGRVVTLDAAGDIAVDGETVAGVTGASDLDLAPDGALAVANGDVTISDLDGGPLRATVARGDLVHWVDATTLITGYAGDSSVEVESVSLAGGDAVSLGTDQNYVDLVVSPDATRLFTVRFDDGAPRVVETRLTR